MLGAYVSVYAFLSLFGTALGTADWRWLGTNYLITLALAERRIVAPSQVVAESTVDNEALTKVLNYP